MMVEHLNHEGTSHSSSDLLKMGASWSAQDFRQTGVLLVLFSFLLPEALAHLVFADLNWKWGGGVAGGVTGCVERCSERVRGVFQTCSRTHSVSLPVVDSPQCWGLVSCGW